MGLDRSEVFRALRGYLDDEHKNKKKKPFDFTDWVDYEMEVRASELLVSRETDEDGGRRHHSKRTALIVACLLVTFWKPCLEARKISTSHSRTCHICGRE